MLDELVNCTTSQSFTVLPAGALVAVLAADLLLTIVHTVQELRGALWRYVGAIVGVRLPDFAGFLLFFLLVTLLLWSAGFVGIAGCLPGYGPVCRELSTAALGFILGARVSDAWFSHIRLHQWGYRPNPGLSSAPYYVAEAVFLFGLFLPTLLLNKAAAGLGFAAGSTVFLTVLPTARLVGRLVPRWRHEPWRPGEVIPAWGH